MRFLELIKVVNKMKLKQIFKKMHYDVLFIFNNVILRTSAYI